ncbi:MAG: MAPEG family protein [Xanthomonadales bacterium]|nr:MAPEG family protein [Xanthomonadales bacterium]
MFYKPMLLPLLAQVLLTFIVWVYLYITRISEIKRKNINPQALNARKKSQELLTDSAGPANNFMNLLEMPVLFYLAILLSLILLVQDQVLIILAWTYVLLRYVHSSIQCTYNKVMHRFQVYFLSCVVLLLIWLRLATYILFS